MGDRLILRPGDVLRSQLRVIDEVGHGTFSNVYLCADLDRGDRVVVKACRSERAYTDAAVAEVKTMNQIMKNDPDHASFVQFFGSFKHKDHVCLIFERLGPSLFANLRYNHYRSFNRSVVRSFMFQIVAAVDILHGQQIVHTDLKLENVLLYGDFVDHRGVDDRGRYRTGVRVIDFGSTDKGDSWHRHLVTTRHYRAPEILMGLRWGYECDVWSLGCMLVELAVGRIDFDAHDTVEHLFAIQQIIGPIPQRMWNECTKKELAKFVKSGGIRRDVLPKGAGRVRDTLNRILSFDREMADLATLMLNPDPFERPRTDVILRHRFFDRDRQ